MRVEDPSVASITTPPQTISPPQGRIGHLRHGTPDSDRGVHPPGGVAAVAHDPSLAQHVVARRVVLAAGKDHGSHPHAAVAGSLHGGGQVGREGGPVLTPLQAVVVAEGVRAAGRRARLGPRARRTAKPRVRVRGLSSVCSGRDRAKSSPTVAQGRRPRSPGIRPAGPARPATPRAGCGCTGDSAGVGSRMPQGRAKSSEITRVPGHGGGDIERERLRVYRNIWRPPARVGGAVRARRRRDPGRHGRRACRPPAAGLSSRVFRVPGTRAHAILPATPDDG